MGVAGASSCGPHPHLVWPTYHRTSLGLRSFAYKMLTKDPFSNKVLFAKRDLGAEWKGGFTRRGDLGFSLSFPPNLLSLLPSLWALVSYFVKSES